MPYRYATEKTDYTDFALGRVFYGLPGLPAFPIRFSNEIFQRCLAVRASLDASGPVTVYDPCCGGAYLLTTMAYLHWGHFQAIIASDIEPVALENAQQNLSLLTLKGLEKRRNEIAGFYKAYGKKSHWGALESARRLYNQLQDNLSHHPIPSKVFLADATSRKAVAAGLAGAKVDMVLTDIPHGQLSSWGTFQENPLQEMLTALLPVLKSKAVVAVAGEKTLKIQHPAYKQSGRVKIGKRQAFLLVLA